MTNPKNVIKKILGDKNSKNSKDIWTYCKECKGKGCAGCEGEGKWLNMP